MHDWAVDKLPKEYSYQTDIQNYSRNGDTIQIKMLASTIGPHSDFTQFSDTPYVKGDTIYLKMDNKIDSTTIRRNTVLKEVYYQIVLKKSMPRLVVKQLF